MAIHRTERKIFNKVVRKAGAIVIEGEELSVQYSEYYTAQYSTSTCSVRSVIPKSCSGRLGSAG
jgi:hypothetical protein